MLDLDVVTVGKWDKGKNADLARALMARIANKEFYVATPFLLLERISRWNYANLTAQMKEFYIKNSDNILTDEDVSRKIDELSRSSHFNQASLLKDLRRAGVGNQDAFLVLVAALFDLTLVTFNRKTLRNKEEAIVEVTRKYGIKPPALAGPEEL